MPRALDESAFRAARILIVDDQEANVRLLERILAQASFENVTSLTDARQVAAVQAELRPDLILLDLHMPHLDGFAVLEQLSAGRRSEGYLPVLVLTADVETSARHRALGMGAQDFVTKPFDAGEVVQRCRNLLETRFLHRELEERNRRLADEVVERAGELTEARAAREAMVASLNRLNAQGSLEETAMAICCEFARWPLFSVVAVLAFSGGGTVVPIAAQGAMDVSKVIGAPVPAAPAAMLKERAARGAWAMHWRAEASDGDYGRALGAAGLRSAWYAPITGEDGLPLGLIVAGSADELDDRALAERLPALVEWSAIARALLVPGLATRSLDERSRSELQAIIGERAFESVYQPIVSIVDESVIGYEALTRFADGMPPDVRFAEAHRVGVGLVLEEAAMIVALDGAKELPLQPWVSVNVSPDMVLADGCLSRILEDFNRLIVLEITEHVAIADYSLLRRALAALGPGVRLAIDDAGAGFASFRHILELQPDFVKLDRELVRGIDADPSRQALVVGMRYFAQQTGCTLISEGVETDAERSELRRLEIEFGQGYLFGRPRPAARSSAA